MARPPKQIVDYFSHDADASEGRTLSILFNNFGHEGISCWWQLLERLSRTSNHVISLRNGEDIEYLAAKLHFQSERLKEVLSKLAELGAIDQELFNDGLIWSQNFVDRLEQVYRTRKQELPSKPILQGTETKLLVKETKLLTPETPHTILKDTILKKLKDTILPEFIDKELWNEYLKSRKKPTEKALNLLIKKLEELRIAGDDPNEVLKRSIMNGWTGIFPLDKKGDSYGAHRQGPTKLPPRDGYTKPRPNPKLDKLVEQQRASDAGAGRDESG